MKRDKAIEILTLSDKGAYVGSYGDLHDAIKAGIEALKRQPVDFYLPGETREEKAPGQYKALQSRFQRKDGGPPRVHAVLAGAEFGLCGYASGAWKETNSPITCKKCLARLEQEARC